MKKLRKKAVIDQGSLTAFLANCDLGCGCTCYCSTPSPTQTEYSSTYMTGKINVYNTYHDK